MRANVNNYQNQEVLKSYSVGDIVPFDPVNYRICDDYVGDTCYEFVVVGKNENNYNLFF